MCRVHVVAIAVAMLVARCAVGQESPRTVRNTGDATSEFSPVATAGASQDQARDQANESARPPLDAAREPRIRFPFSYAPEAADSQAKILRFPPTSGGEETTDVVQASPQHELPTEPVFDQGGELEQIQPPSPVPEEKTTGDATIPPLETIHFDAEGNLVWQPEPPLLTSPPGISRWVTRLGAWGADLDGAPVKVGEFQSLRSSTFWDLDGLASNRLRTIDLHATGLDQDGTQAGILFFGPNLKARADFQRFLRQLDNDPLTGFTPFDQQPSGPLPPAPRNFRVMNEDLNVGEDYAIRLQELDTSFQGKLTENLRWRLNVWGLRKQGERQVAAMAHCYSPPNATDSNGNPVTGIACHVLTQQQRIDWLTTEIEPILETKVGPASVQYSHTSRAFSQHDQVTTRPYDNFGFAGELPYAVVPENQTDIDRLRMGWDLTDRRHLYALLFNGNTKNESRDLDRRFRGFDVRLTDRSIHGVSLTGYAKNYVQTGERPAVLLPLENAATIRAPIDYDLLSAGIRGRWRPYDGTPSWRSGLLLSNGYEFRQLQRANAVFAEQALTVDESQTTSNSLYTRAALRWSPHVDSFVRYRLAFIDRPLFGVPVRNTATNSNLPTQQHLVEIGGTWTPTDAFLLSATCGFNASWHTSDVASFEEDSYPITFTAWYAPSHRWSISGGLAFYSNWIDQDITLGSKSNPVTLPWNYQGRSDVVNIGTTYAWTKRLTFSGGLDFVHGSNRTLSPWGYADVGPLSDVIVDIARMNAGLDYHLRPGMGCYLRYQLFDYEDQTAEFNSGTVNLLLGGFNLVY